MKKFDLSHVAEVKISYQSHVKAADRPRISCSKDAYEIFYSFWDSSMEHHESVKLLMLNRANRVLGITSISSGGISGCIMDVKVIFQYALKANASSILLCHNHPSGNTQPSEADKRITRKVKSAGEILDIALLDHLIITPNDGFLSMTDEGYI